MLEIFESLVERIRAVWDAMTLNQKVISGGVIVAFIIALAYLSTFRSRLIDYTVLFTELDARSATEITSRLEQQNIPYRLSSDGTIIEVPRDSATQLRIELTAEGLPETGFIGYEILDTTTFGMSERIQEVQIQRALEGEMARTLVSLEAVEWAKVNLSIPEQSLLIEMEKPATASVILKFRRGRTLSQKSIEGLTSLIAGSVPGLESDNVTILDTQGITLTQLYRDEMAMLSSTQWDTKMRVDNDLANKAKQLLDGSLGPGKSLVTVNSELNWDRLERMTTEYDQDTSAVLSEDRETQTTPTPDGAGEIDRSTVNYETGQMIENLISNPGGITRLTVGVFIDYRDSTWTDNNGELQVTKVERSDSQVTEIENITETAVGYDVERGDRIEVVQTIFGTQDIPVVEAGFGVRTTLGESIRAIVMGLALITAIGMLFFVLRAIINSLDPSKITMTAEKEFIKKEKEFDVEEFPESDREVIVRKIVKTSMENPEIAAKTIKSLFKD